MGYIKFVLKRTSDEHGNTTHVRISRIESDMADTGVLETNLIMHALSASGWKVETCMELVLDVGILDNNILG